MEQSDRRSSRVRAAVASYRSTSRQPSGDDDDSAATAAATPVATTAPPGPGRCRRGDMISATGSVAPPVKSAADQAARRASVDALRLPQRGILVATRVVTKQT